MFIPAMSRAISPCVPM